MSRWATVAVVLLVAYTLGLMTVIYLTLPAHH